MLYKRQLIGLALAALLAVPASAAGVPLDDNFEIGGVQIRGGGGDVLIAATHRNVGGRLAICALSWVDGNATTRGLQREVISRFYFRIGGSLVRANPARFTYVKSEAEAMRSQAGCSVTSTPWTAAIARSKLEMGANLSRPLKR